MSGSQYVSSLIAKDFAPTTEHWKKLFKVNLKDKKEVILQREISTNDGVILRLFPNIEV